MAEVGLHDEHVSEALNCLLTIPVMHRDETKTPRLAPYHRVLAEESMLKVFRSTPRGGIAIGLEPLQTFPSCGRAGVLQ